MIYEIVAVRLDDQEVVAAISTRPDKAKRKATELATWFARNGGKAPDGETYRRLFVRAKGATFALHTVEVDAEALSLCEDPDCGHEHH